MSDQRNSARTLTDLGRAATGESERVPLRRWDISTGRRGEDSKTRKRPLSTYGASASHGKQPKIETVEPREGGISNSVPIDREAFQGILRQPAESAGDVTLDFTPTDSTRDYSKETLRAIDAALGHQTAFVRTIYSDLKQKSQGRRNVLRFREAWISANRAFKGENCYNVIAALVHIFGNTSQTMCTGCRQHERGLGNGPFQGCVAATGVQNGACSNHVYNQSGYRCSFRFQDVTSPPSGSLPLSPTPSTVDSLCRLTESLQTPPPTGLGDDIPADNDANVNVGSQDFIAFMDANGGNYGADATHPQSAEPSLSVSTQPAASARELVEEPADHSAVPSQLTAEQQQLVRLRLQMRVHGATQVHVIDLTDCNTVQDLFAKIARSGPYGQVIGRASRISVVRVSFRREHGSPPPSQYWMDIDSDPCFEELMDDVGEQVRQGIATRVRLEAEVELAGEETE